METKQKIDYDKVFKLFIGDNEHRPDMHQPFKRAGMYFATDAYSMIFMPDDGSLPYEEQNKPLAEKVIPKKSNITQSILISKLEEQLVPEIINETEEHVVSEKCTECNGTGWVRHSEGKDVCDMCEDGIYKYSVDELTGRKIANPHKDFKMLGVGFKYAQISRLIEACKLMEVDQITWMYKAKEGGNLFECGNVKILIMPSILEYGAVVTEIKL